MHSSEILRECARIIARIEQHYPPNSARELHDPFFDAHLELRELSVRAAGTPEKELDVLLIKRSQE